MKRRDFITFNFAALGGVIIGKNMAYAEAFSELANLYKEINPAKGYDLVVNGGGLAGCFIALEAVKKGLKVLLLDKRTYLGFEITAKRKLWLKTDGCKQWLEELLELFIPEAEKEEVFNDQLTGLRSSCYQDEMLLFAGSIKKSLLRTLLVNKVDLMLMTDAFGVITDSNERVTGIAVACKQGTYVIPCRHIIDATDNNFFTRHLAGEPYIVQKAGFIMELENALLKKEALQVDQSYGLIDNVIKVHQGKKYTDQCFLEFEIPVQSADLSEIEQKMRLKATQISENFPRINPQLTDAKMRLYASESSYYLEEPKVPDSPLKKGYACVGNPTVEYYDGISVSGKLTQAKKIISHLQIGKEQQAHHFLFFSGKKIRMQDFIDTNAVSEKGIELPLFRLNINNIDAGTYNCQLLIAGGGTAGVTAALSAAQQNCAPVIVDYFNDLGGTKTMGGVLGYYLGLNKHPFIVDYEKSIKDIALKYHVSGAISRSLTHLLALNKGPYKMITGAIICGAGISGNKLEKIAVCKNGMLQWIKADLTIDATGDADVAFFAGESCKLGNSRIGITQNYSQWDIPYRKKEYPSFAINKDYDILDTTQITELQRGLFLSHYESIYYDFYPMLTVRESRRPEGIYTLTLKDVLDKAGFEDTIANSYSDFDPHYYGESEYTRCGFMLPHSNAIQVNIPYRSIVPKKTDGLLLSGRGISQTHNALQFTRMSADVALLGHATGQIAAEIIKRKVQPREFSVSALHAKWKQEGFIAKKSNNTKEDIHTIVRKLSEGDSAYLAICCREMKEIALPELQYTFQIKPSLLLAKALSWFGDPVGHTLLMRELKTFFEQELREGHPDNYFEEYESQNLYWKINQNIALLGMTENKMNNPAINFILAHTKSGGKKVAAKDAYNQNRIDLYLIPYYNRILNLCFYIERNPGRLFIKELERLIDDENIKKQLSTAYEEPRWHIFGSLLEMMLASSLARCGAKKGFEILIRYLEDIHADLRHFASEELVSISGKPYGFDRYKWDDYIKTNDFSKAKTIPLRKNLEL